MLLICIMSNVIVIIFLLGLFVTTGAHAQYRKIDTTATMGGNVGYRVSCNNKSESENEVSISPKGFGKDVRDVSFSIKGRLRKILVDDLNSDGYPDLVLCVYSGAHGEMGNVAGIASSGNNSLVPVYFPDIYSNPKLREGYKGNDEFTVMMGTLLQTFPIYTSGDTATATGSKRVIQYDVTKGENGNLTFKALRSYEKRNNISRHIESL